MDKSIIIAIIEGVIFLIPLITVLVKIGGYKRNIEELMEKTKDLPEWKSATSVRVDKCEEICDRQTKTLESMNTTLVEISTKVSLLLENKIKQDN
jgi:hypothetical protein